MVSDGPVLYVLKRYPRLSETFITRELLGLEAAGEQVMIDALLPPEPGACHPDIEQVRAEVRYLPRHPRWRDLRVVAAHMRVAIAAPRRWAATALQARRRGSMRRFLQAGLVADRARRQGVRHIHAHFATAAAEVARDAARLSGVPFTVTAHAKDVFHADNVAHLADRVAGARAVVTVSDFNVAHLRQRLNVPIRRVPNGIRVASHASGPDRSGPVLCVARLVPKKGIDVLIEAAALLAPHDSDLQVQIIGGGQLADDLQRLADRLGVSDRVAFTGPCPWPAVEDAYGRCSMVVLPCRVDSDGDRDGLPTVLLEAMARALPVVSTNLVGIPEVVIDGQTGLLVPPDDPLALAAAIARLRADTELASRLGRSGRALVAERFDPEQATASLRSVFAGASDPGNHHLDRPLLERT